MYASLYISQLLASDAIEGLFATSTMSEYAAINKNVSIQRLLP